jgi:hypothetical protein
VFLLLAAGNFKYAIRRCSSAYFSMGVDYYLPLAGLLVCCFAVVDVATRHVPDSFMELDVFFFLVHLCTTSAENYKES